MSNPSDLSILVMMMMTKSLITIFSHPIYVTQQHGSLACPRSSEASSITGHKLSYWVRQCSGQKHSDRQREARIGLTSSMGQTQVSKQQSSKTE
jgi:hypothetical protein